MALVRHGTGLRALVRAYGSQIHPVFMLPPVAATWFGAILSGRIDPIPGATHTAAIFLAVYTAHLKDGLVDFHRRGEDDDLPLTVRGCSVGLVVATVGFGACLLVLLRLVGPVAVLLTLPTWVIGYFHAPQLDTHPVGATAGYPTGIALALLGGYAVQSFTVSATPLALAIVFLVLLAGVKIIDDIQDYEYDRSIDKRTVAVILGRRGARLVAFGLMAVALLLVPILVIPGLLPVGSVLATIVFGAIAGIAARAPADVATMLLIRGAYLFMAVLLAAIAIGS